MKTGSRSDKTWYQYCMSLIKRTSHAVYDLKYHMVWVPKYHKMILSGHLAKGIRESFAEKAERYGFDIDTMEVKGDHVQWSTRRIKNYASFTYEQNTTMSTNRVLYEHK